jgi:hypothetical protein
LGYRTVEYSKFTFFEGVTSIKGGVFMFGIYTKAIISDKINYVFKKEISLAGCNSGLIPIILQKSLSAGQKEPYKWHINFLEKLPGIEGENSTIVIDIKPDNKKERFVLLCELLDVWGYSDSGWTPVLLLLKGLVIDEPDEGFDKSNFSINCSKKLDDIFTITSLTGSIKDVQLSGKWTFPGPSATNSALLWPGVVKYFCEIMSHFKEGHQ